MSGEGGLKAESPSLDKQPLSGRRSTFKGPSKPRMSISGLGGVNGMLGPSLSMLKTTST